MSDLAKTLLEDNTDATYKYRVQSFRDRINTAHTHIGQAHDTLHDASLFASLIKMDAEKAGAAFATMRSKAQQWGRLLDKCVDLLNQLAEVGEVIEDDLLRNANESVEEKYDPHQGNWEPASGGTEQPFRAKSGKRLLYVYQASTGRHAYLDMDTDLILSDEEADAHMGTHVAGMRKQP